MSDADIDDDFDDDLQLAWKDFSIYSNVITSYLYLCFLYNKCD